MPSGEKPQRRDFDKILRRAGRRSDLVSKARGKAWSALGYCSHFFNETPKPELHMKTVVNDLTSLSDHVAFISTKINFLLDATLGLINNEQNGIIKIVSVAAVVFLPATLFASVYGMNFDVMPELKLTHFSIAYAEDWPDSELTGVSSMASTVESAAEVAPEVEVPATEVLRVGETKASRRSFYRLESGRLLPCEPNQARIIAYTSPTIDDEAELQEQYNIDYHTLQSSLDPDELSRLEMVPDHAAIIFKRPRASAPTTIS